MKNLNLLLLVGIFAALSLVMTSKAQEIGLQLYSLREQMKLDVERNHELIQQWGIRYIEGEVPMK